MTSQQLLEQAVEHHRAGRLAEAQSIYHHLVSLNPADANALNLLGVLVGQQGRAAEAIDLFRKAIAANPLGEFYTNLGNALRAADRDEEAIEACRTAIRLRPSDARTYQALGLALDKRGQTEEAIAAQQQALAIDPRFAPVDDALCAILIREGRFLEVADACRRMLAIEPALAPLHAQLGAALNKAGDYAGALLALSRALELKPDWPQVLVNLAEVLNQVGRFREAADTAQQAGQLEPGRGDAYAFLRGYALRHMGQLSAAADAYRAAIRFDPRDDDSHANLAGMLLETMRFDESIATCRRFLEQNPRAHRLRSDLLLVLNYSPTIDDTQLFEEHKLWATVHAPPLVGSEPTRQYSLPLRVGYVSPDLRTHPVSHFVAPLLAGHDPANVHAMIYCDVDKPDEVTTRLRSLVPPDDWRDVARMTDDDLERQIRQDRIDILVDLAGHTGRNRLMVFARKPAPIQVTYLGYPNTTGLPREVMRYRITDAYCDPPGLSESLHTEELVRLADCFICYEPPEGSPPVLPVPSVSSGRITFGSFNAMPKISEQVIELWACILRQVPQSRLMLKNRTLHDPHNRRTLHEMFGRMGIADDRVVLIHTVASPTAHLQQYCEIDVALDPFPYHGTTTTCEALWMGVPVITLAGHTHRSRVGVTLLSNVGRQNLIANTSEQYVELAVELARDMPQPMRIRSELRERMRGSSLTDSARFIRNLEAAYAGMRATELARSATPP